MASAGGLSRRRVGGNASASNDDDDDHRRFSAPSPNGSAVTSPVHAGSAFAGGSKIAYDPRDLEREDEDARLGGKPPRLTIMEEVLLLGLKDKQVSCYPRSPSSRHRNTFHGYTDSCTLADNAHGCRDG